jgi:hypothetical protein
MFNETEVIEEAEIVEEITEDNPSKIVHGVFNKVDEVVQSEGVKPENFDELPVVSVDSTSENTSEPPKEKTEYLKKMPTLRYPTIEWGDINVRKMFFSLLTQSFNKYGTERKGKVYLKGLFNYIDVEKRVNVNPLDRNSMTVNLLVFDCPKRNLKFSFELNDTLTFKLIKGTESKIFKLFLENFNDIFQEIATENQEQIDKQKSEEEVAVAEEKPVGE